MLRYLVLRLSHHKFEGVHRLLASSPASLKACCIRSVVLIPRQALGQRGACLGMNET